MTGDLPGDIGGAYPLGGWLNKLKRAIIRRTLQPGLGYKLRQTEQGTTLEILPGGGGRGATITRYHLKSVQGNYLVCRTWDGTTEGDEDIYIAKVPKLRLSVTSETLDSVVFNYTYPSGNVTRTARSADNSIVESQVIVPRFLVDDEIWAISASTGIQTVPPVGEEAEDISLMDLNLDARAWTQAI